MLIHRLMKEAKMRISLVCTFHHDEMNELSFTQARYCLASVQFSHQLTTTARLSLFCSTHPANTK